MTDKELKTPPKKLFEGMGFYVGIANPNKPVIIDTWHESNRDVEHMNILGVMGDGKGFSIKPKEVRKRGINYGKEA
jgi:hypothetical protein